MTIHKLAVLNDHNLSLSVTGCVEMIREIILVGGLFVVVGTPHAMAECVIADAQLEEAISKKPEFRDPANRQMVKDLRHLRDSAFLLWSYGLEDGCNRLLGNIRELIASPSMGSLGGSDEDTADQQLAAKKPAKRQGGRVLGNRKLPGARPLVSVDEILPGIRADEVIGAEVRTSDDKIVGEVRNIVLATKDRRNYAIVASGGFFVPGKNSLVVPIRFLQTTEGRETFYLLIPKSKLSTVPLMPDGEYSWLADDAWRARNDALFSSGK